MLRFLADENFNNYVVRGMHRAYPEIDLVRVQDVGLSCREDPVILAWAAEHGRVLLTHDARTVPRFAAERVARGLSMSGVFVIFGDLSIGETIELLQLAAMTYEAAECEGRIEYLS